MNPPRCSRKTNAAQHVGANRKSPALARIGSQRQRHNPDSQVAGIVRIRGHHIVDTGRRNAPVPFPEFGISRRQRMQRLGKKRGRQPVQQLRLRQTTQHQLTNQSQIAAYIMAGRPAQYRPDRSCIFTTERKRSFPAAFVVSPWQTKDVRHILLNRRHGCSPMPRLCPDVDPPVATASRAVNGISFGVYFFRCVNHIGVAELSSRRTCPGCLP